MSKSCVRVSASSTNDVVSGRAIHSEPAPLIEPVEIVMPGSRQTRPTPCSGGSLRTASLIELVEIRFLGSRQPQRWYDEDHLESTCGPDSAQSAPILALCAVTRAAEARGSGLRMALRAVISREIVAKRADLTGSCAQFDQWRASLGADSRVTSDD